MSNRTTVTPEERARERDPWKDMPQPPGSKEAAVAAAQLKLDQARPKSPTKPRRDRV
jgi:hypothetical protein